MGGPAACHATQQAQATTGGGPGAACGCYGCETDRRPSGLPACANGRGCGATTGGARRCWPPMGAAQPRALGPEADRVSMYEIEGSGRGTGGGTYVM